ncbi:zinc-finger-containing protein [Lysinibacillus sp. Ag94]|uniref:zinc-finger-containing protein n=1 Tax=Lysinibacillus sp. Ag94 TaxID=2936682 RepID=UPI0020101824|nr:zinc-finger-containing protein [Lysinibacillus sp. Ag94]UPW82354.1 DUF3268 family zinc-finger domain-containing protein [Lysinibacillus sp. Ag94]
MICGYCGNEAEFMSSKQFYGRDYGVNMYVCRPCDAYVGTHGKGKTPLGTLANARLRNIRRAAHSMFDPLWKGKYRKMSRSKAYRVMQELMDLPPKKAHIGMMDEEQCFELIRKLKEYRGLA